MADDEPGKDVVPTHVPDSVTDAGDSVIPSPKDDPIPEWAKQLQAEVRGLADKVSGLTEPVAPSAPEPVHEPEHDNPIIPDIVEDIADDIPVDLPWTHRTLPGFGHKD